MTATIENELPEARAIARYVRVSASKARRVVDLIRGRKATDAVTMLEFAPQGATTPVRKTLQSAMANAADLYGTQEDDLWVQRAYVDEGPSFRRIRPRAQGRVAPIHKRTCHITVIVGPRPESGTFSNQPKKNRRTR